MPPKITWITFQEKMKYFYIRCSNVLIMECRFFKKFPDFIFLHFELMQIKFHSGELFGNTGYPVVTQPSRIPKGSSKIATVYSRKGDVTELDHCWVWIYKLDAIPVWTISSNPTNALLTSCVDLQFWLILQFKYSLAYATEGMTWLWIM